MSRGLLEQRETKEIESYGLPWAQEVPSSNLGAPIFP
jgi:hypothetical protein